MNVMIILLILVSMVGMIFGLKKHKEGLEWGRPLTIAFLLLGVLVMVLQFRAVLGGGARERIQRETSFREALGGRIGQIVASEFGSNPRVVVIPDVGWDSAVMDGFMSAVRGTGTVEVLEPDLEAYFRERMRAENIPADEEELWLEHELEFAYVSKQVPVDLMNDLLRRVEGTPDVLVLFSALPINYRALHIMGQTDRPRIILASAEEMLEPEQLASGLERGLFYGVVIHNDDPEGWRDDTRVPRDVAEAFAKRYIWVTRENYRQHL